jgi:hypothetical protein
MNRPAPIAATALDGLVYRRRIVRLAVTPRAEIFDVEALVGERRQWNLRRREIVGSKRLRCSRITKNDALIMRYDDAAQYESPYNFEQIHDLTH